MWGLVYISPFTEAFNVWYVIFTDYQNVGMLVCINGNISKVFSYRNGWLNFNFLPYIDSSNEDVAEEYREIDFEEKNRLITEKGIVDGSNAFNWANQ